MQTILALEGPHVEANGEVTPAGKFCVDAY
jgi:hypothetical protein